MKLKKKVGWDKRLDSGVWCLTYCDHLDVLLFCPQNQSDRLHLASLTSKLGLRSAKIFLADLYNTLNVSVCLCAHWNPDSCSSSDRESTERESLEDSHLFLMS